MSILIKGIAMPKSCMECEWRDAEACGECELMIDNPFKSFEEQYKHCPFVMLVKRHTLIELPPHGRLIDADALLDRDDYDTMDRRIMPTEKIVNAPTIIEAEEGE